MSSSISGAKARIPLSLVTGFLGSGKTTVLNRLVRKPVDQPTHVRIDPAADYRTTPPFRWAGRCNYSPRILTCPFNGSARREPEADASSGDSATGVGLGRMTRI